MKIERSAGGLATAMNPILNRTGGLWIGWAGDSVPDPDERRRQHPRPAGQEHCVAINIPPEVAEQSYGGYSNQVLWPLFHYFASDIRFESEDGPPMSKRIARSAMPCSSLQARRLDLGA